MGKGDTENINGFLMRCNVHLTMSIWSYLWDVLFLFCYLFIYLLIFNRFIQVHDARFNIISKLIHGWRLDHKPTWFMVTGCSSWTSIFSLTHHQSSIILSLIIQHLWTSTKGEIVCHGTWSSQQGDRLPGRRKLRKNNSSRGRWASHWSSARS